MVNDVKVKVCDNCNVIDPDINLADLTCMDCGEPLVLAEFVRRPTPCTPDVATATSEEEALRILNDCIAKLQGVTRHAGNT